MGCDIHAYIEYGPSPVERELGTKRWVGFFGAIHLDRDYSLFAALSNTRNDGDIEAVCEPRGLPATVSAWVQADEGAMGTATHDNSAPAVHVFGRKDQNLDGPGLHPSNMAVLITLSHVG